MVGGIVVDEAGIALSARPLRAPIAHQEVSSCATD